MGINDIVETEDNALSKNKIKYYSRRLSSEIDDFQILCIYNQEMKTDEKNVYESLFENVDRGTMTNGQVFHEKGQANTFIIWEQAYQENEELFVNLRHAARNELILRIGQNIIGYLLKKYEDYLGYSIKSELRFKEKGFINKLVMNFDNTLKRNTFLGDNAIWEEFCSWFRVHLTEWILEDMETSIGLKEMGKLNRRQLNELFYTYITENFSKDLAFMENFMKIVNEYTQAWIKNVVTSMDINEIPIEAIKELLDIEDEDLLKSNSMSTEKKDISFNLIKQGNLLVMSNAPYQSVREALNKKNFLSNQNAPWPTAELSKGTIKGIVQIVPCNTPEIDITTDYAVIQKAWAQSKELSEYDVDVFDALCSIFLSKAANDQDLVEIYLDDLLVIRGLKPKLSGNGRRGGYEINQRKKVLEALKRIQNLWINLEKAVIYKRGKAIQTKLQGRAFIFKDHNNSDFSIGEELLEKRFQFTVDEVFAQYLHGSGRQVALLPVEALQYNPYQQEWEKRLIRYLSWRWRTQARKGDYLQPHKISTLLDATGKKINRRTPSRTRDRLEQAFDKLLEDGIIASWRYERWDESIASNNGWARIWRNSTILIEPPETIIKHYRPIKRNEKIQHISSAKNENPLEQKRMGNIGKQLRSTRKGLRYTLLRVSEELGISVSYLSNIERGIKMPSNKIQIRVMNWLEQYEFDLN